MEARPSAQKPAARWLLSKMQAKGMRPRFAAYLIGAIWMAAVIVFGVVQHLVDPDSFPTVWLGMWWALQTVTTVGYGDAVPADAGGKVVASVLLLVGLSFLAVVTGVITSAFVTQAQADRRKAGEDPVLQKLDELTRELASIKAEVVGRGKGPD